jgi:winged helix-turn-helix protein
MVIDEQQAEEAVGKVFGELGVAITGPLIVLGDRLGLGAARAGAGRVTPDKLAAKTGTVERYVREWLRGVDGDVQVAHLRDEIRP